MAQDGHYLSKCGGSEASVRISSGSLAEKAAFPAQKSQVVSPSQDSGCVNDSAALL